MQLSSTHVSMHELKVELLVEDVSLLFADKQPYKTPDEIIKDPNADTNNSTAAIIKSASTPASLQTIVRFSNGSNMSLQHKVSDEKLSIFLPHSLHNLINSISL